jgi:hypothetical protein
MTSPSALSIEAARLADAYPEATGNSMAYAGTLIAEAARCFGIGLAESMAEVALIRGIERGIDPFFVLFSVSVATGGMM